MKATGVSPFGGGYECEIHSLGDRFYVSLQLGNDTSDRERTADSNLGLQDLRTEDAFTRIAVFCCVQRRDEHHAQVSSCRRQCACLCAVSCAVCMAIHPIYLSLHPSIDPSLSLPLPPSLLSPSLSLSCFVAVCPDLSVAFHLSPCAKVEACLDGADLLEAWARQRMKQLGSAAFEMSTALLVLELTGKQLASGVRCMNVHQLILAQCQYKVSAVEYTLAVCCSKPTVHSVSLEEC